MDIEAIIASKHHGNGRHEGSNVVLDNQTIHTQHEPVCRIAGLSLNK